MDKVVASVLPYAVAVALSPMPIAALILMLLSNRAKVNSIMFLIGWIAGLFLLGVVLVLLAIKEWHQRPKKGEEAPLPKWMGAIETFSPFKAFGIGLLLATI